MHLAAACNASMESVNAILKAFPQAVTEVNHDKKTPMQLAKRADVREALREIETTGVVPYTAF